MTARVVLVVDDDPVTLKLLTVNHLTKPFEPLDLVSRVAAAIDPAAA